MCSRQTSTFLLSIIQANIVAAVRDLAELVADSADELPSREAIVASIEVPTPLLLDAAPTLPTLASDINGRPSSDSNKSCGSATANAASDFDINPAGAVAPPNGVEYFTPLPRNVALPLQVPSTSATGTEESLVRRSNRLSGYSPGGVGAVPRSNRWGGGQRVVLLGTGLLPNDKAALANMLKLMEGAGADAHYADAFDSAAPPTHVVTVTVTESDASCAGGRPEMRICKRTLKVMQGMLCGSWLVSTDWLYESLKAGFVLDEESFEIQTDVKSLSNVIDWEGPRKARQSFAEHVRKMC
jgi:hypothetical protein